MANLGNFDLNLLKVLDALLAERSTTAAGKRIGLSQPAVSAALGRLRHALGDELFTRAGQGLAPTDFALSIAEDLRALLNSADAILTGPGQFDPGQVNRTFNICGADYVTDICVPPFLRRLTSEAPQARVSLLDEIFERSLDRMRDDRFDLLVVPAFAFPGFLEHQEIFRSQFVIGARKDHPRLARAGLQPGDEIPLDLFCDLDHVRFAADQEMMDIRTHEDRELEKLGRKRTVRMGVPGFGNCVAVVVQTDLIAVLPRRYAEYAAASGKLALYRAPIPMESLPLTMVWHRRQTASPTHRWFREMFAEEARKIHPAPEEQPVAS